MMSLYKRELKCNLKSMLIWAISVGFMIFIMFLTFDQMKDSMTELNSMINKMPESLVKAFGMNKVDTTTAIGFYAVKCYIMIALFGAIYGALIGGNIISKEEKDKTLEFLLSKPLSRENIFIQKTLAFVTHIFLFSLINFIILIISIKLYSSETVDIALLVSLGIAPFMLCLTFGLLALLISTITSKGKGVFPISLGLILFSYFLNVFAVIDDKLKFLGELSFFKYMDGTEIVLNGSIDIKYIIILVIFNILVVALAYFIFKKKEFNF